MSKLVNNAEKEWAICSYGDGYYMVVVKESEVKAAFEVIFGKDGDGEVPYFKEFEERDEELWNFFDGTPTRMGISLEDGWVDVSLLSKYLPHHKSTAIGEQIDDPDTFKGTELEKDVLQAAFNWFEAKSADVQSTLTTSVALIEAEQALQDAVMELGSKEGGN